jgi:hypothetical protein
MHGYCKCTLVNWTDCTITSTTSLTTLVGMISTIIPPPPPFYYDGFPWHDLFFHSLNKLRIV